MEKYNYLSKSSALHSEKQRATSLPLSLFAIWAAPATDSDSKSVPSAFAMSLFEPRWSLELVGRSEERSDFREELRMFFIFRRWM
jgi:hypothetical protein